MAPILANPGMEKEAAYTQLLFIISELTTEEFDQLCDLLVHDEHNQNCSIIDLFPLVDWIYTQELCSPKSIVNGYTRFVGPASYLANVTLIQYITADPVFMQVIEHRSEPLINQLCAILYVPKGTRYDGNSTPWLPKVEQWPTQAKQAMLINWMVLRRWFAQQFPLMHRGNNEDDAEQETYDPEWGRKLIYDLPAEDFGKVSERKFALAIDVFDYLERLKEKSNDQQPGAEQLLPRDSE